MFALSKGKIIQNHCVILILHSDFPYSYTFSWGDAVQTTSPAPRRPRNNSVVTMIQCLPSANCRSVAKQQTYRAQAAAGISDGFPKENGGVSREVGIATCQRQVFALLRMTSLSGAQQSVLPRRLNTVVFLWKTVRPEGQVRNMGCAPFTPASQVRT